VKFDFEEEIKDRAHREASKVKVPDNDQLPTSLATATAVGSVGYYLGEFTKTFETNGIASLEIPIYSAFAATAILAALNLRRLCGRPNYKQTVSASISGGTTGLSIGIGAASIWFSKVSVFI